MSRTGGDPPGGMQAGGEFFLGASVRYLLDKVAFIARTSAALPPPAGVAAGWSASGSRDDAGEEQMVQSAR